MGLAAASLIALVGTAVGTRLLAEVVAPEVYGDFKLTVGIGILAVGVVFQPLTQYAMRAYHDAQGIGTAGPVVAEGRREVSRIALVAGVVTAVASLIITALIGDLRIVDFGVAASLFASATAAIAFETGLLDTKGAVVTVASYRAIAAISLPIAAALAATATGNSSARNRCIRRFRY